VRGQTSLERSAFSMPPHMNEPILTVAAERTSQLLPNHRFYAQHIILFMREQRKKRIYCVRIQRCGNKGSIIFAFHYSSPTTNKMFRSTLCSVVLVFASAANVAAQPKIEVSSGVVRTRPFLSRDPVSFAPLLGYPSFFVEKTIEPEDIRNHI
jgi:hypothetical protein